MELYSLQVFLTIATEKSFSRAGEKLLRTQPAVKSLPHLLAVVLELQLGTRKRWIVASRPFACHRIRSTHRARNGPGSNASPKYWVSRATFRSLNSMMLTA